jgi:hypothetical protein
MPENTNYNLPKWPFLVGDVILIILACFIVIASPKPMSAIEIFACALSVILGMLVYLTPFIVDHLTQQQRIRLKQVKAEETLLRAVELASDLLNRTEAIHSELMKGVLTVKQVPVKLEEKAEEIMEIFDAVKLSTAVTELSQLLDRIETYQSNQDSESKGSSVDLSEIKKALSSHSSKFEIQINSLQNRIGSEIKELKNEILDKPHKEELDQSSSKDDSIKNKPGDNLQPKKDTIQHNVKHEPSLDSQETSTKNQADKEPSIFEDKEDQIVEISEKSPNPPIEDSEGHSSLDGTENSQRQNEDGATGLIVGAFIGISNKLYIRGEGPGLAWDKGIPMELVGIGKWEWKTYDASTIVRCKVLINDEQSTDSENIDIEPNTTVETTASF